MSHNPPVASTASRRSGGFWTFWTPAWATYVPLEPHPLSFLGTTLEQDGGWLVVVRCAGQQGRWQEVGRTLRGCGGQAVALLVGRYPCTGDDSSGRRVDVGWAVVGCGGLVVDVPIIIAREMGSVSA